MGPEPPRARAPRARDMPAPRRNESAAGSIMQRVFAWPYRAILAGLYRLGVRPWQLTLASLLTNIAAGVLLLRGDRLLPGLLLIPAGAFDVFDGSIARLRGEAGRPGAFMDSVLDRVSDMILFGCLFWSLARLDRELEAALALVTMIVALTVSHVRARVEAAGVSLTEGVFQRLERYLALMAGLVVPGALLPVLAVLATLGSVTMVQRLHSGWRRLRPSSSV
jgi:CDP-diacylglycerol--glycerol-3-phosphate 3-phosphatidyltransferase